MILGFDLRGVALHDELSALKLRGAQNVLRLHKAFQLQIGPQRNDAPGYRRAQQQEAEKEHGGKRLTRRGHQAALLIIKKGKKAKRRTAQELLVLFPPCSFSPSSCWR